MIICVRSIFWNFMIYLHHLFSFVELGDAKHKGNDSAKPRQLASPMRNKSGTAEKKGVAAARRGTAQRGQRGRLGSTYPNG
jgi:hypothetical protein